MVTDGYLTYCGDHFIKYVNVKSLCCAHETNIACQLSFSKKMSEAGQTVRLPAAKHEVP